MREVRGAPALPGGAATAAGAVRYAATPPAATASTASSRKARPVPFNSKIANAAPRPNPAPTSNQVRIPAITPSYYAGATPSAIKGRDHGIGAAIRTGAP